MLGQREEAKKEMCCLVSFGRHQTLGIRIQVGKGNVYHRPVHTLTSTGDLSQVWRSLDRLGGGKEQCDTFFGYLDQMGFAIYFGQSSCIKRLRI